MSEKRPLNLVPSATLDEKRAQKGSERLKTSQKAQKEAEKAIWDSKNTAEARFLARSLPNPHPVNLELSDGPLSIETDLKIRTRVKDSLLEGSTESFLLAMIDAEAAGLARWSPQEKDWVWRSF